MTMPTLCIAEYQSFTISDIQSCLKDSKNIDSKVIHKKALKIFDELKEFASFEQNAQFLGFKNKNTLKAKNYVGLIQTKSNFCLEILPKTFSKGGISDNRDNINNNKNSINNNKESRSNSKGSISNNNDETHKHELIRLDKEAFSTQVNRFLQTIINTESNHNINTDSNQNKNNIESNNKQKCQICQARQILLNCLYTLKDLHYKEINFAHLATKNLPLLEIFIQMFLDECNTLVKRGLKSDYLSISCNRAFLKGKLLFHEHVKSNFIHKERFFTQSDEYTQDIAPNRLIKSTLNLLKTLNLSHATQSKLYTMLFIFDNINESKNIESDFTKCNNMTRLREYRHIISWCKIFLNKHSFTSCQGREIAFALLFPMEKLFESFVAFWLKRNNKGKYNITTQESKKYLIEDSKQESIFMLKPDIVMKCGNEILILDTKWKIPSNADKKCGVSQDDLYQLWAYASKYKLDTETIKVYIIYPQCERIESLYKEWQNNNKWCFKANRDIELSLKFFPLVLQ